MTDWLTDDEQRLWRHWLDAQQRIAGAAECGLAADGLSHADYELLVRLSEAPGRRLRMSELASRALVSRSRLSHAARRLEDAGWLVRERSCDDARGTVAVLTDAGFAVLAAAAPGHVAVVRRALFDHLDAADRAALLGVLERLAGPATGAACDAAARAAAAATGDAVADVSAVG